MPAFLFLTGLYARFSIRRVIKRFVIPYLVFQMVYKMFYCWLYPATVFDFKVTTPFWLLWYLMAVSVYYFLLPLFNINNRRTQIFWVIITVIGSILVGYNDKIGYYFSLSRIIVFFPFFLSGFYVGKSKFLNTNGIFGALKNKLAVSSLIIILLLELYFFVNDIPASSFYGASSYLVTGTGPFIRILMFLCSFFWLLFLFVTVPNTYIRIISEMGRNTMIVFLLHGFLKMIMQRFLVLRYSEPVNLFLAVLFVVVIMDISNLLRLFITSAKKRIDIF